MGRGTVYNNITSPEKLKKINQENKDLMDDFLEYLESVGRAATTIKNYRADLQIFFCWCLDELDNKSFVKVTKREIARFQNYAIKTWGWSPNRLRTVKSALASLGNYIESILDEEYEGYRSIVRKVESPPKQEVREKTVWSEDEIQSLLDKLVEQQDYEKACFVALAAFSGRRKAELCRFKVSDFDDDKLIFDGALYKSEPIKTKGRGGGKYLNCYTLAKKFKPYLDLWIWQRSKLGLDSEWLFPNKINPTEQINTATIDAWSDKLSHMSGKEFYPHSLRHAFTTYLLKSGIPDGVVQTIIGWGSAAMLKVYDDRPQDEQIEAFFAGGDICVPEQKELKNL